MRPSHTCSVPFNGLTHRDGFGARIGFFEITIPKITLIASDFHALVGKVQGKNLSKSIHGYTQWEENIHAPKPTGMDAENSAETARTPFSLSPECEQAIPHNFA